MNNEKSTSSELPSHRLLEHIKNKDQFIEHLSIDCVILGFHDNTLKVLLPEFTGTEDFVLPGGYLRIDEGIDDAANRILFERTGLKDIYLEQFACFGNSDRNVKETMMKFMKANNITDEDNPWVTQRFITIGYYALVDYTLVKPIENTPEANTRWFDINELPSIGFDHLEIIQKALENLRRALDYKVVGSNLLPEKFTMKELQSLYETILGKEIRRSNFQKKILDMEILERLEKKFTGAANKAPYLYKFK